MTNPYRSPDPLKEPGGPPTASARRLRRAGRLCIVLGIAGLLLGFLVTLLGMFRTFSSMGQSQPEQLSHDIAVSVSTATIASACGIVAAAVLLPLGIVLLIRARSR